MKSRLLYKQAADYYYNARQIVTKNEKLFKEGKIDKCTYFEYVDKQGNKYKIFNPFKDEKGAKQVDPKQYYGEYYDNSDFNKVN